MCAGGEGRAAAGPLLPVRGWSGGRQPSPGPPARGATGIRSRETFPLGSEVQRGEVAGPGRTGAGNRGNLLPFGPSLGLAQASDRSRGGAPPRPRPQAGQVGISRFFSSGATGAARSQRWDQARPLVSPGNRLLIQTTGFPEVLALLAPGQRQAMATRFRRFRWFKRKGESGARGAEKPSVGSPWARADPEAPTARSGLGFSLWLSAPRATRPTAALRPGTASRAPRGLQWAPE